jgi:hypothetical protein
MFIFYVAKDINSIGDKRYDMTSIRKSHISVAGYKTKERFDNLVANVQKVRVVENTMPRNIGLFVTPEKLSEFIYVRVIEHSGSTKPKPNKTGNDKEYFIGWKVVGRNKERKEYKFEYYVLHSQDFPITDENYNPNFTNSPDGEDTFLIPHEGIPVEEMLNRMLGISKEVSVDSIMLHKIYG